MTSLLIGTEKAVLAVELNDEQGQAPSFLRGASLFEGSVPSFLAQRAVSATTTTPSIYLVEEGADVVARIALEKSEPLERLSCPGGPAHLSLSSDGQFLFTASYGSGETRCYQLGEEGQIRGLASTVFTGKYTHCVMEHPSNGFLYATAKGDDKISVLSLNRTSGELSIVNTIACPKGSGPRHIVFSADGLRAFVSCENSASLIEFSVAGAELIQKYYLSSLRAALKYGDTGSDLHLSADQQFLYVSNRGEDSLATFRVQNGAQTQAPELVSSLDSGGKVPRNFALVGDDLLLAANQESMNISAFRREHSTGALILLTTLTLEEKVFWVGAVQ